MDAMALLTQLVGGVVVGGVVTGIAWLRGRLDKHAERDVFAARVEGALQQGQAETHRRLDRLESVIDELREQNNQIISRLVVLEHDHRPSRLGKTANGSAL